MHARPRARNPRGEGGRLRDEIVRATATLLDHAGDPAAVTLRAVARQAGVSAPSIYAHFADLDQILALVLAEGFSELDAAVEAAMNDAIWPDARLVAGCLAHVQFGWTHRARYRVMTSTGGSTAVAAATFRRIEDGLRDCVKAKRSSSTDTRLDTLLLWAGMHGLIVLERPDTRRLASHDRLVLAEVLARRIAGLAPPKSR